MFRLEIKNLGPFRKPKVIETENRFIEVREPTATGKTTIARVLYSFLTGHVDTSLLTQGVEEGYAKLLYDKEHAMVVRQNSATVDKVLGEPYAEFLVLTEGTPLYSFYVTPPKFIDLEELVKRFVPPPPELMKLEAELKKHEPKSLDAEKLIDRYQTSLESWRRRLAELTEELRKVDEELAKAIDLKKVKPVLEKQKLLDQVRALEEEIRKKQDEHSALLLEIQGVNYEELKLKYRDLSDRIERLYRRRDMIDAVLGALEKIKDALDTIRSYVDILMEHNVPLFGRLVDPRAVEMWLDDVVSGIDVLTAKRAEIQTEISSVEQEKSKVETALEEYANKYQRIAELESAIARRKKELETARIRLSSLERQVKDLEKELGMSEDEILRRAAESQNADKLLAKKRELERQIEEANRTIKDLEAAIERIKQRQAEAAEAEKQYEELRRRYNSLRNEWNERRKLFKDTFREAYRDVFRNITIPDFDPETMTLHRPPHTYSQGERLLMTIAFQYALVSALSALGCMIPMVVIDLIVPIDERYESEIKRVLKNLDTFRMILKTTNESAIIAIS